MRFNTNGFNPSDEKNQAPAPKRVAVPVDVSVFTASLDAFEEKVSELRKEFKSLFQDRVKILFDAVPDLENISIVQYTPYFNDGDTCEFSINSVSFSDQEEYERDWDGDFASPLEQQKLKDALKNFIYGNEDLMRSMYGDHAEIIITREGTEVNEYDHE